MLKISLSKAKKIQGKNVVVVCSRLQAQHNLASWAYTEIGYA